MNKSSKADFAEAAASLDFFPPSVAPVRLGFRENQPQKLALSGSEGLSPPRSAALSAQPEGR
ncbi:MAG: hypothetical protein FWC64_04990 [Treponema sp.]|nr:hypothetical protein [Treponema sp.]